MNGTNLQTVPTGTVSAFAGSAAPTGYALCDGSAVNRTAQASLFGVIGTTYGAGDGSTTFNLPDLKGRVVAGLGGSLIDTSAVVNGAVSNFTQVNLTGNLGGTIVQGMAVSGPGIGSGITVQIVTNQNTIHLSSAVTLSDGVRLTFATTESLGDTGGAKTHTLTESEMPSHNHSAALSGISGTLQFPGVIGGGNKLVSANTSNTGGDEAHNNVQPTIILNYIIKT